jgi:hypothetical protein
LGSIGSTSRAVAPLAQSRWDAKYSWKRAAGPERTKMLQSLLAEGRPRLADGATGTNLRLMLHKLEARTRELNPPRRPERTRSR